MRSVDLPQCETRTFAATAANVAAARAFAIAAAQERGWVDTLTVELLVSELTTNAVKAATELTVTVGGCWHDADGNRYLELRVADNCPSVPPSRAEMPDPAGLVESGRGLPLVGLLAHESRWEPDGGGKACVVTLCEGVSSPPPVA
ncbi:ATP-binding protein [Kitasatospora sp. RB6PN24]|uniref:ATP-binding protein n=1 Tax=Kitasatospora humi TaxID=2893891 RepID=UPI001E2D4A0E|nr:ATP-binding protein [Kitasatospora humi]MCC9307225.1 ATP-binding protein [Kitasatospora humi]